MDSTTIVVHKKLKLNKPALVEGLPGIGLVGKLVVDHMVREMKAVHLATLYSPHFPHQVIMQPDGTVKMLTNELYVVKAKKQDIMILAGDVQAVTSEAQYEVTEKVLDYFASLGGTSIYTLGGYGTGKVSEKPKVFGAVTDKSLIPPLKKAGVIFGAVQGGIVGAAGMLPGLGTLRGMKGVCLMGETHGQYVDARSAASVIEVLMKVLGFKVNTAKLKESAKQTAEFMRKTEKEVAKQRAGGGPKPSAEEKPSYIR